MERVQLRKMSAALKVSAHLCTENIDAIPGIIRPSEPGDIITDPKGRTRQELMAFIKAEGIGEWKHDEMWTIESRLVTLNNNLPFPLNRQRAAEAGFFYTGSGMGLACFHCGMELRGWTAACDPWLRHVQMNHSCLHVCRHFIRLLDVDGEGPSTAVKLYRHMSEPGGTPRPPAARRHSDAPSRG